MRFVRRCAAAALTMILLGGCQPDWHRWVKTEYPVGIFWIPGQGP